MRKMFLFKSFFRKPMRENNTESHGFTLIELLVVVLIIGVLTAVALPRYEKTIERTKATQALVFMRTFLQAEKEYYLANGQYASSLNNLSINIPFSGNNHFLSEAGGSLSSKSNQEWILELELTNVQNLSLLMGRRSGKYKGAGFMATLQTGPNATIADPQILCFERLQNANYIFSSSLKEGAYCQQVIGGSFLSKNTWNRKYNI